MPIAAGSRKKGLPVRKTEEKEDAAVKKKLAAWVLCLLMVFQLAAPPSAKAGDYVYFVAVGENILPLSAKTMPFWNGGYLYIASSVITGNVRDTLGVSCVRNNSQKRVVLYSREEAESLFFDWEKNYATDKEGNTFDIPTDSVILSVGYKPAPLSPKAKNVHIVGDAAKVGNLRSVIWGAWDVCMKI